MTQDLLQRLQNCRDEASNHLENELLPFWVNRCRDDEWGGYLTHFDQDGNFSGEDEKSLIAQSRTIYTFSSAHRAGYGNGKLGKLARHGVYFLLHRMWDSEFGGFYWMVNRKGDVTNTQKILYGHSFAVYALSEYSLATGDPMGIKYAEKSFKLIQQYCSDTFLGGYYEMFWRDWLLKGPGSEGGDRKTLDVHMHLMEAFTTLYECSRKEVHRRKLEEVIEILINNILHPKYRTGIPQYTRDWSVAPQIKFDIVWGWDRFTEDGVKKEAEDNTSYGHNVEFAWLLRRALDVLEKPYDDYLDLIRIQFDHALADGIDWEYGGVYVEGSHAGGVYDREKEFWQNAEMLIGLLDACLLFGEEKHWTAYENVHRFVFDKMINHDVGEWWPLMTRDGKPIWTHMSHSWKVNYHTVRSMIQVVQRLDELLEKNKA
jgi:mannobiose 2-epimerase